MKNSMSYAKHLKKLFQNVTLDVEDLFLLESFQIKCLPDRLPKEEFAVLLRENQAIQRYFIAMYPPINSFINDLLKENGSNKNNKSVEENYQNLLWEIADLVVYNKHPQLIDTHVGITWKLNEITTPKSLDGKVVIDAGAGTGRLAFMAAQFAKTVFAIEPAVSFRQLIKERVNRENVKNLFVVDGFLDSIPFPDNFVDFLMTSNAIGWNIESELKEIERILKPNGKAIHLIQSDNADAKILFHDILISPEWQYNCTDYKKRNGLKLKYFLNIDEK